MQPAAATFTCSAHIGSVVKLTPETCRLAGPQGAGVIKVVRPHLKGNMFLVIRDILGAHSARGPANLCTVS